MNIGIDIDLTIVPSDYYWQKWLRKHFKLKSKIPEYEVEYDLGKYFHNSKTGLKHFDFWQNNHLYDEMDFIGGCEDTLKAWKGSGNNLIFISHTQPGHFSSKCRLLKRLPFIDFNNGDAFVATKEKGCLSGSVDVMIDDRNKFLNQFDESVVKVKYETRYNQDEELKVQLGLRSNSWNEIQKFVSNIK